MEKVFGVKSEPHFLDVAYLASYFITVILTFFLIVRINNDN